MSPGSAPAQPRWLRAAACGALVLAAVGGARCRPTNQATETGLTGIELTLQYATLSLDQITLSGSSGSQETFGPDTLPAAAQPLAPDQETVAILLSEALAGTEVRVRADGLAGSGLAGSGQGYVVIQARVLVSLVIALGPAATCADGVVQGNAEECDDGSASAGDGCSPSCVVETGYTCTKPTNGASVCTYVGSCDRTCAGCCAGTTCTTPATLTACGVTGSTCMDCSVVGNRCSPDGQCTCGAGPACGPGLHCVGDACVCDGVGCGSGCCAGNVCSPGSSEEACGTAGLACDACPAPHRCVGGVCGCDDRTCPSGCCSGTTCSTASFASCGRAGAACVACSPDRADACSPTGACTCGGHPACGDGQRCEGGACTCDPGTCPTGCCAGTTCTAPSMQSCGTAGGACAECDPGLADNCAATGLCQCGSGPACPTGGTCSGGSCGCGPGTCSGCCAAGACVDGTSATACGKTGAACTDCTQTAHKRCDKGNCR